MNENYNVIYMCVYLLIYIYSVYNLQLNKVL